MNRKQLLGLLLLTLVTSVAGAQQAIVITRTDMPNVNDTFRLSVSDNLLGIIDLNDTGADRDWNYATLPVYTQRTEGFVDPVFGTPLAYNITFSNFFDPEHFATIAAPNALGSQQFGFGPVQMEEVYDFFRETNTFFANVGMGATINNVPVTSKMQPRDIIYRFPMEFGSTDQSFSQFGFDVPGFGHYGQKMLRTNSVDGWGTLVTRFGTFDALRVYTELERTDTVSLQGFGFDQQRPKEFEIKWLGKEQGIPLLRVSGQYLFGQRVVNEVVFLDSVRGFTPAGPFEEEEPQAVSELSLLDAVTAFPNPVSAELNISFSLRAPATLTLTLRDLSGRTVLMPETRAFGAGMQMWPTDLSSLAPAIYMLQMTATSGEQQVIRVVK
jgi:hypothetical protein